MEDSATVVELDELSDHDLLVRIATQIEVLPDLERRVRALELEITRLKLWAPILGAAITGAAVVISALLGGR
jgi:hypothetical protein